METTKREAKKNFFCPLCWYNFLSLKKYLHHIEACHDNPNSKKFHCDMCDSRFETMKYLKEHIRRHNKVKKPMTSKKPLKSSINTAKNVPEWLNEFNIIENRDLNITNLAKEKLESPTKFVKMWWQKGNSPPAPTVTPFTPDNISLTLFECKVCLKIVKEKSKAWRHYLSCNKKPTLNCSLCSSLLYTKDDVKQHKLRVHEIYTFDCGICQIDFDCVTDLIKHLKSSHEFVSNNLCETCGKIFGSKKSLVRHIRLHKKDNFFKCTVCLKTFTTKDSCRVHYKIHLLNQER